MKKELIALNTFIALAYSQITLGETYSYSGPNFLTAVGPYSTEMSVTATIVTSAPIPANVTGYDISGLITTWTFSDGVNTLTNSNATLNPMPLYAALPLVSTNSSGQIVSANFRAAKNPLPTATDDLVDQISTFGPPSGPYDSGSKNVFCRLYDSTTQNCGFLEVDNTNAGSGVGSVNGAAGVWTGGTAPSYNVEANVIGVNGTVSCSPTSVASGASSTCTATPDSGFQVSSWSGDCASAGTSNTCSLVDIQSDQSSEVSFEAGSASWDGDEIFGTVYWIDAPSPYDPWQLNWAPGSNPVPAYVSFTEKEFEQFSMSADFGTTTLTIRIVNDSNSPNVTYPPLEFAFTDLDVDSGEIGEVTELESNFDESIGIAFTSNSITLRTGLQNTNPGDNFFAIFQFGTAQPQNAEDMIEALADQVLALNLKRGISNALDSKLMSALATLQDANDKNDVAAINKLYAFIANVDAQSGNMIEESEAEALIAAAESIIGHLLE